MLTSLCSAATLFVEAESFDHKGGWVIDQQFMDQMGSPYLMAHGMGDPVHTASTTVTFPQTGTYYIYVRTYNWTSPWKKGEGAGKFRLAVNNKTLPTVLGSTGDSWLWQDAGKVTISKPQATLALHDLTGFNGRCDAIYFTTEQGDIPPSDMAALEQFRRQKINPEASGNIARQSDSFDLVVVGGGIAGICAAVSAARLGCKVALINDRPVLGGNNSSEVRVHLGGRIEAGTYKALGNIIKEFGPTKAGNAQPAENYEDDRKADIVAAEPNISLFPNYHVMAVEMDGSIIRAVHARHIENGSEQHFQAPLFADCTGDGSVGFLAGADYRMGREARDEYNEPTAPEKADRQTMGASVQWYSEDVGKAVPFPAFSYGVNFNETNCEKVVMGEWTWETGMNRNQVSEFEYIRDYGLMVVFSNWSFLKNRLKENTPYRTRQLQWVAYIAGKRESRRLLGDYILKEDDITKHLVHEDGTAAATWTIDLHYPDPKNTANFPDAEFKSIAEHKAIHPYPIPYRCLYSRNVNNLFMAGRNISVTHVALGTTRLMRTTGMLGEVVGMAASICKKNGVLPRDIYQRYLPDLKALMTTGTGNPHLPNNQQYNQGGSLGEIEETK
jgi:hypothetical protein